MRSARWAQIRGRPIWPRPAAATEGHRFDGADNARLVRIVRRGIGSVVTWRLASAGIKKIAKSKPAEHDLPFSAWTLSKLAEFPVAELPYLQSFRAMDAPSTPMHQPAKMAQMVVRDVLCRFHTMKPARMNAQTTRPPMTHTV